VGRAESEILNCPENPVIVSNVRGQRWGRRTISPTQLVMLAEEDDPNQTHRQEQDSPCRQVIGQIVHARKCNKSFFFLDVRVDEQLKCTVLFRSDDPREQLPQRLSDSELAAQWRKVRRGDTICLQVFDPSQEEVSRRDHFVYQAADFTVLTAWSGHVPFPPEPAMGFKQSDVASHPRQQPEAKADTAVAITPTSDQVSWEDYCKFWINSHRCLKKDCQKKHPTGEEYASVQAMWVKERTQARRERSKMQDDPHAISSKVPHSRRALIFCRWLVHTFGKDYLNSGTGVLDVAGGKGEISLFLTHMFGIRSTVVEPKVRKDKSYQRRNLMEVIQKELDIEAGGDGRFYKRIALSSSTGQISVPCHPDPESSGDGARENINDDGCEVEEHDQGTIKKERKRLKKQQRDQFVVPRLNTLLDSQFEEHHGDMLEGASILIGMHPDQATEPIVDMALKHKKPFAVVPCCVFGQENPHRRLSNGGEVNTTLDLIQYLMEKDTSNGVLGTMHKEFLAFDGMNIVVFYRPAIN